MLADLPLGARSQARHLCPYLLAVFWGLTIMGSTAPKVSWPSCPSAAVAVSVPAPAARGSFESGWKSVQHSVAFFSSTTSLAFNI